MFASALPEKLMGAMGKIHVGAPVTVKTRKELLATINRTNGSSSRPTPATCRTGTRRRRHRRRSFRSLPRRRRRVHGHAARWSFVLVAMLALPGHADAWGFEAHLLIMERAIAAPADGDCGRSSRSIAPGGRAHQSTPTLGARPASRTKTRTTSSTSTGRATARSRSASCRGLHRGHREVRPQRASGERHGAWRVEEMFGNLERAFRNYPRRGAFGRTTSFTSRRGCRTTCPTRSSRFTA
jgi:hypothetical protein